MSAVPIPRQCEWNCRDGRNHKRHASGNKKIAEQARVRVFWQLESDGNCGGDPDRGGGPSTLR